MEPNADFLGLSKEFWANVRTISEGAGYTHQGEFLVPTADVVEDTYEGLDLDPTWLVARGRFTEEGQKLVDYLRYRADALTSHVQHELMNAAQAKTLYNKTRKKLAPSCPQPTNNQGKAKGAPRYLTCLVNMIVEEQVGLDCDFNPLKLTAITKGRKPVRTLARRVDGAYPSAVNPVALWEIKEYYFTTTFGSRVADGVYESLLDGMELEELRQSTGENVLHYLMIDAKDNWWNQGKSYLCRTVDMTHMGYVDEVLYGRDVVNRLPDLARSWKSHRSEAEMRDRSAPKPLPVATRAPRPRRH